MSLPRRILDIKNPDKKFHEKWTPDRDMLNFPHPYRMVIFSNPNTGKGVTIKNVIIRADPPFEKIIVIHIDGEYTCEYDDVEPVVIDEIPPYNDPMFDGEVKTLLILDDIEYKYLPKQQLRHLDRILGYTSTHRNVSVALLAQDAFNLPVCCRRMSNVWVLGESHDKDSIKQISRKCGLTPKFITHVYDNLFKTKFDKLWVDNTKNTPYPLRLNGYTPVDTNIS